MRLIAKDDLRNRIAPRLRTFHTNQENSDTIKGAVAWRKAYIKKDYCQSTLGYTCERSSAGGSGVGGQG